MIRLANFFRDLRRDLVALRGPFLHDRSFQIVAVVSILPWVYSVAVHRDAGIWQQLAEIYGLIAIYWFFTRRWPLLSLPVRRRWFEILFTLALVAGWVAYRAAEYSRLIAVPNFNLPLCGDFNDSIVPKMLEMAIAPLLVFLLLRYSFRDLGLGLPGRSWIPALIPLAIYIVWGLVMQKPDVLATRTTCFYFGAGLPEELLFRALLLPRLFAFTRRPAWDVLIGGLIFGATHIPINLFGSHFNWAQALETAFTFQMGVGVAFGYAFVRTRNVWPLTLIHGLIDSV